MRKALFMSCLAVAALVALVVSSAASASPALTNAEGTLVPVGTEIKGVLIGNGVFTGGFNVTCSGGEGTGKVTENTGTSVKGEMAAGSVKFSGTGTGGDCTSALGAVAVTLNSKLCLSTNSKLGDQGEATGCGAPMTASIAVTGSVTCKYEMTKGVGVFSTSPQDASVTVSEQEAKGESTNSFLCPSSGKLDFALSATTITGGTLVAS
ncbi:MAG TPA: hypothetical protein VFP21_08440 [Solirubrobacterales bacterium]|nr:hypothetical protein [Solirubrobacterales bacterium]